MQSTAICFIFIVGSVTCICSRTYSDDIVGRQNKSRYEINDELSFDAALVQGTWKEWRNPQFILPIKNSSPLPAFSNMEESDCRIYYLIDESSQSSVVLTTWKSTTPTKELQERLLIRTAEAMVQSSLQLHHNDVKSEISANTNDADGKIGFLINATDLAGNLVLNSLTMTFDDSVYQFQTHAKSKMDHERLVKLIASFKHRKSEQSSVPK